MAGTLKRPGHIITDKLSGEDQYVLFYILPGGGNLKRPLLRIRGMSSNEKEAEKGSIGVHKQPASGS